MYFLGVFTSNSISYFVLVVLSTKSPGALIVPVVSTTTPAKGTVTVEGVVVEAVPEPTNTAAVVAPLTALYLNFDYLFFT